MEKIGNVYAITNMVTGKKYFGETRRNGETRINEHRSALKNGYERNKSLLKDYSEIGENKFTFEVIIQSL